MGKALRIIEDGCKMLLAINNFVLAIYSKIGLKDVRLCEP
jgi:hypothetical protein